MAGPGLFLAASAMLLVAEGSAPRPSCWFTLERDAQPAPATETWVVTRHCRGAAAPAAAALGPAVLPTG
jgi:hypothetical protein